MSVDDLDPSDVTPTSREIYALVRNTEQRVDDLETDKAVDRQVRDQMIAQGERAGERLGAVEARLTSLDGNVVSLRKNFSSGLADVTDAILDLESTFFGFANVTGKQHERITHSDAEQTLEIERLKAEHQQDAEQASRVKAELEALRTTHQQATDQAAQDKAALQERLATLEGWASKVKMRVGEGVGWGGGALALLEGLSHLLKNESIIKQILKALVE